MVFKNNFKYFFLLLLLVFIGCAKRGTISGGPKDTIAPTIKMSLPENFSINFKEKIIKLTFDEYVKLKNIEKELIISPPMEKFPEISPTTASKFITIKIKDSLQPNTTYSFDFGKSIEDNNEGNPYKEFKYVFSTGTYIDSLTLSGTIKDAYDKKTATNISLMLYEANSTFNDSLIYKQPPFYITKTVDSSKVFKFENLKEGKYYLVALKDENGNNKFNPKKEKIGFLKNAISIPNDTIFNLNLFKEKGNFQAYIPRQMSANRMVMGYEGSPKEVDIEVKNLEQALPIITTKLPDKDSVQIWYKPLKADSLSVKVKNYDYVKNFNVILKDQKKDSLIISSNQTKFLNFRDRFTIKSTIPLVKFDNSKIQLIDKDSTSIAFKTEYDIWNQELKFDFQKEPNEKYKIKILPGAMKDYLERENDSLAFTFETKSTADYGNLILKLQNVKQFPIIVELVDKNEKIIASEYSENSPIIDFKLIEPARFTIRVIYDVNKNKEWDSGNYLKKEQPEEVIFSLKEINLHANFDWEETIDLSHH